MESFFPALLITYLSVFRQAFSRPGFPYFQGFIWALMILPGRKCVTRISRVCFFIDRSLSSWERFLAEAHWDSDKVLGALLGLLRKELGSACMLGKYVLVGIDPTFVAKVKGRMLGVQKWHMSSDNPDRGEYITGHQWAICGLLAFVKDRWQCFAVMTRQVSGQKNPSHFVVDPQGVVTPMNIWQAVLALIYQVACHLTGTPLCVVADAYFSKAPFINPLVERGICCISRLRHDGVGFDEPVYSGVGRPPKYGRAWKLADLFTKMPHEIIPVHLYGQYVEVAVVVRDMYLREVKEKVRLVITEGIKRPIILVCTDLELSTKQIIEAYGARYQLELAIRDLKGHLGFSDYQATKSLAFSRFVQLCCVALSLARLILRPEVVPAWCRNGSADPCQESDYSLHKLRRGLRRLVLDHFLFSKSASEADLGKTAQDFEPLYRIVA